MHKNAFVHRLLHLFEHRGLSYSNECQRNETKRTYDSSIKRNKTKEFNVGLSKLCMNIRVPVVGIQCRDKIMDEGSK